MESQVCPVTQGPYTDLMRVALYWYAECATQSQVSYLQTLCVIIYQQILRLQVTMHHAMLVTVRSSLEKLIHEALHDVIHRNNLQHGCEYTKLITNLRTITTSAV